MPVRKNFLYEFYGCYKCPFWRPCIKLQAGGYTFKDVGKDCPEIFENQHEYELAIEKLEETGVGGKILNGEDRDNIDDCRPEVRFWKELNLWSLKFYYADDGGYDITWAKIFFNSKEEIINWLTEYEE